LLRIDSTFDISRLFCNIFTASEGDDIQVCPGAQKNLPERADFLLQKGQPPEGDGIRVCPGALQTPTKHSILSQEKELTAGVSSLSFFRIGTAIISLKG